MDKTIKFSDTLGIRRGLLHFFQETLWFLAGALTALLVGFFIGALLGGCTDSTGGRPAAATAFAPVTAATSTASAQKSFDEFLARIDAVNANLARDNGSPAQQQLLIDASGAALAGAVAAASEGTNPEADVAALAGAVKAINDVAQLPSVQGTKSAQVCQAIASTAGAGRNASVLALRAGHIYDAATAKGADPTRVLLAISQGYSQAQAQATAAAFHAAAPVVAVP